jgi:hypothetical protein
VVLEKKVSELHDEFAVAPLFGGFVLLVSGSASITMCAICARSISAFPMSITPDMTSDT